MVIAQNLVFKCIVRFQDFYFDIIFYSTPSELESVSESIFYAGFLFFGRYFFLKENRTQ